MHVLAHRTDDGHWESLVPEFTIAGMGDTVDAAAVNAFELLSDYLVLCARDGRTFKESYRPAGWSLRRAVFQELFAAFTAPWQSARRRPKSHARYKVPLQFLGVHQRVGH